MLVLRNLINKLNKYIIIIVINHKFKLFWVPNMLLFLGQLL